jgi:hypothetical protein
MNRKTGLAQNPKKKSIKVVSRNILKLFFLIPFFLKYWSTISPSTISQPMNPLIMCGTNLRGIIFHIQTYFQDRTRPFIIYSDCCGYQNRNAVISNAFLDYAIENNIVIEQKYLDK